MLNPSPTSPHEADTNPELEIDRRAQPRHNCGSARVVHLAIRPSFRAVRAIVSNVSAGGLGLTFNRALDPGTILAVQVRGRRLGVSLVRVARVVHATQTDGHWRIGCTISPPFSPEELQSLL
jgi:PilZ domain-containing protein